MKYSDILRNEHFNALAAVVRLPHTSSEWRNKHAIPFWQLIDDLTDAPKPVDFLNRLCDLLVTLTKADHRLSYTEADLAWFTAQMDREDAMTIAALLLAWASAPDTMLTPVEIAEATGTHESNWRNKAAAGDIPGAVKKGKQWLLPRAVLRSRGLDV